MVHTRSENKRVLRRFRALIAIVVAFYAHIENSSLIAFMDFVKNQTPRTMRYCSEREFFYKFYCM